MSFPNLYVGQQHFVPESLALSPRKVPSWWDWGVGSPSGQESNVCAELQVSSEGYKQKRDLQTTALMLDRACDPLFGTALVTDGKL